jgi:hypothetical protein
MSEAKPFCISKWEVWEAYKRVKANKGAAGVDEQTIEDFEKKLKKNLYKIWNRMSSGSYFPPPVRTVKIPKANGGEKAGHTNCFGSNRATGGEVETGTRGGSTVSCRLLRISTGEVGVGGSGQSARKMLAL